MDFSLHLLTLLSLLPQSTALWCYQSQFSCDDTCRDPSRWAAQFPSCGGLRQSPINIVTSKVRVNSALPPFSFIGHSDRVNVTVQNKGHSAHFALPPSVQLTGGGLTGHYRAAQFHFHWGGDRRPGSEHTIDGERFPMELHIVHIKAPYSSLAEAEHDMAGIDRRSSSSGHSDRCFGPGTKQRQQHGHKQLSPQGRGPACRQPPRLLSLRGLHDDARMRAGSGLDRFPQEAVHQQSPAGRDYPSVSVLDGAAHDRHLQTHAASRRQDRVLLHVGCSSDACGPRVAVRFLSGVLVSDELTHDKHRVHGRRAPGRVKATSIKDICSCT
ncbi:carbonic anhydrase IV c isoform X3 [Betta splendens]|uniref:Carbonic anhydrase n=1 Tax=Betta splendens TaxID=158456 RepID=A0A9W2Y9I5_BETSP|nr:carbonic anhydrase IV c isoform X3 [Betta splendens]